MAKKALTQATYATDNIQSQPNQVKGQAATLKLSFDQTGIDQKTYNNNTLIPELGDETLGNSGSNTIGHNSDSVSADNVGDGLEENRVRTEAVATDVANKDAQNVKLTGNQTIAGVKTFSSAPKSFAAPSASDDVTRKDYVDGLDAQNVKITGNQSVAGVKTFTSNPKSAPLPIANEDLANKQYVDSQAPLTIPDGSITNQKLTDDPDGIKNAVYGSLSANGDRYVGNTKLANDFQDITEFGITLGTISEDTVNVKIGSIGIKVEEPNATGGDIYISEEGISKDFSKLLNGEDSTDDDYIYLVAYVSDSAAVDTALVGIQLAFSQGAAYDAGNRKIYRITSGIVTGWNYFKIPKSDFTTNGTGAWDGVQSIRYQWRSNDGYAGEYITFQLVQLVKSNAALTAPNPFQYLGVEEFDINGGELSVIEEFGAAKIIPLNQDNVINAFQGKNQFDNFIISAEMEMEDGGEDSGTIGYHVDSDNNIRAYFVNSTTYRIGVEIGGVTTNYDISVNAITTFARYSVQLQRSGEVLEVSLNILGDKSYTRKIDGVTINGGYLAYGTRTDAGKDRILSISITELPHAATASRADVADRLAKQPYCRLTSTSDTSVANATNGIIVWDTPSDDNNQGGMFNPSEPSQVTIRETGRYFVGASIRYDDSANVTGYRAVRLRVNSADRRFPRIAPSSNDTCVDTSMIINLNVGDVIEANPFHTAGVSVDVTGNGNYSPVLEVAKIS